jgi:uncharacterized C2H2 Zn-finger protein
MVLYQCLGCQSKFKSRFDLTRHINTKKHQYKNPNSSSNPDDYKIMNNLLITCQYCNREFTHTSSLTRHVKENRCQIKKQKNRDEIYNQEQFKNIILERLNQIEAKVQKQVNQIGQINTNCGNTTNNNVNIAYLNQNYGNMLDMDTYIENLQTTHPLMPNEIKHLLASKDSGIQPFFDCFIEILKDNCSRQIHDSGIILHGDKELFPLITTDSNLRTHNEKTKQGWERTTGYQNLKKIYQVCNDQVFLHSKKMIHLNEPLQLQLYNQIKKANFLKFDNINPDIYQKERLIQIDEKRKQDVFKIMIDKYTSDFGRKPDFNLITKLNTF